MTGTGNYCNHQLKNIQKGKKSTSCKFCQKGFRNVIAIAFISAIIIVCVLFYLGSHVLEKRTECRKYGFWDTPERSTCYKELDNITLRFACWAYGTIITMILWIILQAKNRPVCEKQSEGSRSCDYCQDHVYNRLNKDVIDTIGIYFLVKRKFKSD